MCKELRVPLSAVLMLLASLFLCQSTRGQSAVTVALNPSNPSDAIPDDFSGASYETATLLGGGYFNSSNQPLLNMFAQLGLRSLRIGGNTVEGTQPSQSDITHYLQFAAAAGVKDIYSFRLKTYDPAGAAATASFILGSNPPGFRCFAIGNEPDVYISNYSTYQTDAVNYMAGITDTRAKFCGPDVTGGGNTWVVSYAQFFAPKGRIAFAERHNYFGKSGAGVAASTAISEMLSTGWLVKYQTEYDAYVPQVLATGLGYRLSETNSFFSGGVPGATNAFASALWGLDYMWWWATHKAEGLNFHTGDHVSGATTSYALFTTSSGGYHVHPLGYAVRAFALAGTGKRVVPVTITNPGSVNMTAYSALASDGSLYVTVVNKTYGSGATTVNLTVQPGGSYGSAEGWFLQAPNNDVTVLDGETLGGARINDNASWNGVPTKFTLSGGNVSLTLQPATGLVIKFSAGTCNPPAAPSNLTATATSSSQINLSWTASATAGVTYNVMRNGSVIQTGVTGTTFSDTGLQASTTYSYAVEAVNSCGTSAQSNPASATTQACTTNCPPPPSAQINSGGPAVSPFVADTDFAGGSTINHANTINTSKVTNPAPAQVYQTARIGNFTYTIPGFTAGSSHTVRLHFCETFFTTAGSRTFNVSINGTQVLTHFDIFATAGGQNIANIQQFTENANASGQYVITFTTVVNNSLVSGIQVQ